MKQQRNTRQRQLVLDARSEPAGSPHGRADLSKCPGAGRPCQRGTVYRNLNLLCEKQDIYRVVMADCDRFDLRADPHHHMRCVLCGSVVDVDLPYDAAYDAQLSRETGYRVLGHRLVVEGHLPGLQKRTTPRKFPEGKKTVPLRRIPCQGTFFNAVKIAQQTQSNSVRHSAQSSCRAAAKARSDFSVSGGARHAMPQSAVSSRGVGIRRPGRLCSLHRASMAMAAAVVWNVTTSQNIRSLISLSP